METEEQTLEREQNERDVLDAVGEYSKCPAGMSVENVPTVVNIKRLKGRLIPTSSILGDVAHLHRKEEETV